MPKIFAKRSEFAADFQKAFRIGNDCADFAFGANHPGSFQDAADVVIRKIRHFPVVKIRKALFEYGPFDEHQHPRKSAAHGFHQHVFEHFHVVVDGSSPLLVVVGFRYRILQEPIADGHITQRRIVRAACKESFRRLSTRAFGVSTGEAPRSPRFRAFREFLDFRQTGKRP